MLFLRIMDATITEAVICRADAGKIWQALTEPSQMKEWYFDVHDFELVVGNTFYFYEPGENKKFRHLCTILEIKPNQKFSHTWTYPELSKGKSVVTWNLHPQGEFTKVILTHEHLESFEDGGKDFDKDNFIAGWNEILHKSLMSYVEK